MKGRAHRFGEISGSQPNLVSGHEIGRDRDEWNTEILDAKRSKQSSAAPSPLRALDHAAAAP